VWLALTLVITSYMGVEVIAVTADEAENPPKKHTTRHAHDCFSPHPLLPLAVTIMLAMTPVGPYGQPERHRQLLRPGI
jgi:L-asparagine transporter-like permease